MHQGEQNRELFFAKGFPFQLPRGKDLSLLFFKHDTGSLGYCGLPGVAPREAPICTVRQKRTHQAAPVSRRRNI